MHIQIIKFRFNNLNQEELKRIDESLTRLRPDQDGLLLRFWTSNPEANTCGGVYVWRDREAMEDFLMSTMFRDTITSPHFAGVKTRSIGMPGLQSGLGGLRARAEQGSVA